MLAKIVDSLELYAPVLKGLQDVHAYVCDKLEGLVFDERFGENHLLAAAYIYGELRASRTGTAHVGRSGHGDVSPDYRSDCARYREPVSSSSVSVELTTKTASRRRQVFQPGSVGPARH